MHEPTLFYADQSGRGKLRLTGRDRQSFLQGMVTNDVAALAPGGGCYAFLLDATGHILSDVRVLCLENSLLLDLEPGMAPVVAETLERYLIMEKCRIAGVTSEMAQVFIGGSGAFPFLESLGLPDTESWTEGQNAGVPLGDSTITVAALPLTPNGGFAVYLPIAGDAADRLRGRLAAAGAVLEPQTDPLLETLRIEAGIPRYGVDLDSRVLAPESGLVSRAISYHKGCYIGQEIVARIHARGHTNRALAGFVFAGEAPLTAESAVTVEGKEAGRITSSVFSPHLGTVIALGFLRNEFAAPGTVVISEERHGTVTALPFIPR